MSGSRGVHRSGGERGRGARAIVTLVVLALGLPACGDSRYDRADLPTLVLQRHDAPKRTVYVDGSSGFKTADEFGEDEEEREALRAAGYRHGFVATFLSSGLFRKDGSIDPQGAMAVSFAIAFRDEQGATRGLRVIAEDVRRDGEGLQDRPKAGLPAGAVALAGTLQPGQPPGYLFAWREKNAVMGLIAAGAPNAINEAAARHLVARMRARA